MVGVLKKEQSLPSRCHAQACAKGWELCGLDLLCWPSHRATPGRGQKRAVGIKSGPRDPRGCGTETHWLAPSHLPHRLLYMDLPSLNPSHSDLK